LPSASWKTLGKETFADQKFAEGKAFAESNSEQLSPVVTGPRWSTRARV